ncbi:4-hydroxy-3-methylbut-2-enyl diphosphate reductase [Tepidibacter hydrothermalis]|uniref:4-hydroxy-3-methylbut-2-enyl diphosphate reductase n=1 Tax=Tepidibacter hydrothermalis TaxID=3036126 RepID=A0ABY8EJF9_9FIRM|nr:4-hydroxy-3-methylbut-2-enyl diphosphate reductase [Tepidibacter hydrothermalis]WFD12134.1 4-hydroxy-3-methylbut-2-enyl diphosphate reductase [Tepidibacter hydrothermalis]
MKFKIADYAGFCFGVQRAMDMAWEELETMNDDEVYSLGPLIHNKQAVKVYEDKGLNVVDDLDKVNEKSKIIIRSHGVSKDIYRNAVDKNLKVIDATCPFVKKIQDIANEYYNKGYKIIIVGDKSHPEVVGINGWCNNEAITIKNIEDLSEIPRNYKKYCVVAQTTINLNMYKEISEKLKNILEDVIVHNTICLATRDRQKSASQLSKEVDCMIVIGGKHSSNTQKLVKICEENVETYHIETVSDLHAYDIKKYSFVGITAGASTPSWIIEDVIKFIKNI